MAALTRPAYVLIIVLLTSPIRAQAQENLSFLPPPDWVLGNTQQTGDQLLMEFVKKGEKIDNWTELLTFQQLRRTRRSPSSREFYESVKQLRDKRCPGLTQWEILEESEGSLLYEWKTTGVCENQPPQSEMVRLIFGRNTGYRVAYTSRSSWTAETRTKSIDWLRGLSLSR